jgi:hypothetical protein
MKKLMLGVVIVAVVAVALASTGAVYAQSENPPTQVPGSGYGMGGRGSRGGMMGGSYNQSVENPLHDAMIAAVAEEIGLTVEEIEKRLEAGETLSAIALTQGFTVDEFSSIMIDARNLAIDQAVTDGTITQEQADWMKTRSSGMFGAGAGTRGTAYGRGAMFSGSCPMTTPAQ